MERMSLHGLPALKGLIMWAVILMSLSAGAKNLEFLSLWNFDKPEDTEKVFMALLPDLSERGNADAHGVLLTQIARTHSLRGQFDEARGYLSQVKPLLSQETALALTYYHLELGRTYNSEGNKVDAQVEFKLALTNAVAREQEALAIDAVHMLAIAAVGTDDDLMWNLVGLKLAEAATEEKARVWLGPLYNNIGWSYFDRGDYRTALSLFEKGVQFREEQEQRRPHQIARWTVARTYRAMGRYEEALRLQEALLAELNIDGIEDGYVYEELAELYLTIGQAGSDRYFGLAWKLLSEDKWLVDNERERIDRLKANAGGW